MGTREQGNKGTREQGNKGTREQGNKGIREQEREREIKRANEWIENKRGREQRN
jgi:hypothetical protein